MNEILAYKLGLLRGYKGHYNIQKFAEGDGDAGASGDDPDGEGTSKDNKKASKPGEKNKQEPEKKYTDDDVNEIINKKFAQWEEKQSKKVDEAKKLAAMSASEKAQYESERIKKELAEYKRRDTLAEMAKTARTMLSEKEISVSDDLLSMIVSTDADTTKANVDAFTEAFKSAVEAQVKKSIGGPVPKSTNSGRSAYTKESIMKIQDTRERQRLINEHIDLFKRKN